METFIFLIALMLLLLVTTEVAAAYLLIKKALESGLRYIALNERAAVATIGAVSAVGLGFLGANRVFEWHLAGELVLVVLSISLLIKAVPNIVWLYLYFFRKFR